MTPAPSSAYWEDRARRFAGRGAGLRAVCSYDMPAFYNGSIHLSQWLALRRWLRVEPGERVLDVGCGVGRWSCALALGGATVTGVDLSPTMVDQARRRAERAGIAGRCRFLVGDLAEMDLGERFPRLIGVTVLQHVVGAARLAAAIGRLAAHLEPGGRAVLLEAAPGRRMSRLDSGTFEARPMAEYLAAFARVGLRCAAVGGVDPAPFKRWLLPYYRRLPRGAAPAILALATILALPVDLVAGRTWVRASWHKLFVLRA